MFLVLKNKTKQKTLRQTRAHTHTHTHRAFIIDHLILLQVRICRQSLTISNCQTVTVRKAAVCETLGADFSFRFLRIRWFPGSVRGFAVCPVGRRGQTGSGTDPFWVEEAWRRAADEGSVRDVWIEREGRESRGSWRPGACWLKALPSPTLLKTGSWKISLPSDSVALYSIFQF